MTTFGKIPPQDGDIERAVLGSLLVDASCHASVFGVLTHTAFYIEAHRAVFEAAEVLYKTSRPIDMLTVTEQLRKVGKLDAVGGPVSVADLTVGISSGLHVEEHCRLLQDKQMKRAVIDVSMRAAASAYNDATTPEDCISIIEQGVARIDEIARMGANMRHISVVVDEADAAAKRREALYKDGRVIGVRTGLNMLDRKTCGWQPSELIVVAGRPSMGKTALMIHHALSASVPVCVYSLEMSAVSVADRMVLAVADIDPGRYRAGAMTREDWVSFEQAREVLRRRPVYIDDNPVVTTRYIRAHSKKMRDRGLCEAVFVDYLQLTDMRSEQHQRNREQEVSQAAREFKVMAKSLGVPVILLSQLSRECEKRSDKRPSLSDLRESGAIEQDADVVVFAYRPAYYGLNEPDGSSSEGIGHYIIAKGRNIGTGEVVFRHNASMTKIWDYDPLEDDKQIPF